MSKQERLTGTEQLVYDYLRALVVAQELEDELIVGGELLLAGAAQDYNRLAAVNTTFTGHLELLAGLKQRLAAAGVMAE
jgi:hypothetical protein